MRPPLVLSLALALYATGAWADRHTGAWADRYTDCRQTKDLDLIMRACTQIIEGGKRESQHSRARAYSSRGVAYMRKGEVDRAIADYSKAIALGLNDAKAYMNRGTAYEKKGNKKQALADFRKVLDINPMMLDAKLGLKRLGVTREELALYLKPGVFGTDDRRIIDEEGSPWSAIGHVNVPRASYCTGSLIASNLVITAAHCVMDLRKRKPWPVDKIHFVAGAKRSKWLGHSTAKCLHFPLGYDYNTVVPNITDPAQMSEVIPRRMFSGDMALIVLKDDLKNIPPLQIERAEELPADISLVHASYPADRRWMLGGHFGCHLLRRDQHLWYTDCDVYWGSSGGPIFVQRKQELNLAAIMVGAARKRHSIGVPIGDRIDLAAARKCH